MPRKMEKISDRIKEVKNEHVRSVLKDIDILMKEHLTPLAIRTIVEYIIELESKTGGQDGR